MVRRLVLATLAAGLLVGSQAGTAGASLVWADDPPVLVVTPAGNVVPVYVTSYSDLFKSPCVDLQGIASSTAPGPNPGTSLVDIAVTTPSLCGRFSFTTYVTTGLFATGSVYVTRQGSSTSTLHLRFIVDEP